MTADKRYVSPYKATGSLDAATALIDDLMGNHQGVMKEAFEDPELSLGRITKIATDLLNDCLKALREPSLLAIHACPIAYGNLAGYLNDAAVLSRILREIQLTNDKETDPMGLRPRDRLSFVDHIIENVTAFYLESVQYGVSDAMREKAHFLLIEVLSIYDAFATRPRGYNENKRNSTYIGDDGYNIILNRMWKAILDEDSGYILQRMEQRKELEALKRIMSLDPGLRDQVDADPSIYKDDNPYFALADTLSGFVKANPQFAADASEDNLSFWMALSIGEAPANTAPSYNEWQDAIYQFCLGSIARDTPGIKEGASAEKAALFALSARLFKDLPDVQAHMDLVIHNTHKEERSLMRESDVEAASASPSFII